MSVMRIIEGVPELDVAQVRISQKKIPGTVNHLVFDRIIILVTELTIVERSIPHVRSMRPSVMPLSDSHSDRR